MDQAKIVLVGRLSCDVELKDKGTDNQRALFSIASNRGRGDNRKASFFDCIAWGKRADIMSDFSKGAGIFVTGDLEQDTYQNKDGQTRHRIQVNISSITATTSLRRSNDTQVEGGETSVGVGSTDNNETAAIPF